MNTPGNLRWIYGPITALPLHVAVVGFLAFKSTNTSQATISAIQNVTTNHYKDNRFSAATPDTAIGKLATAIGESSKGHHSGRFPIFDGDSIRARTDEVMDFLNYDYTPES